MSRYLLTCSVSLNACLVSEPLFPFTIQSEEPRVALQNLGESLIPRMIVLFMVTAVLHPCRPVLSSVNSEMLDHSIVE